MFTRQQSVPGKHQSERQAPPVTSAAESRPLSPLHPALRDASVQPGPAVPLKPLVPRPTPPVEADLLPASESGGSRLIVGPLVKLKGAEILDCDTLVVEGSVEATMDSRVIRISKGGAFRGKVSIDIAEIHGDFDGELIARQQLIIHATGRVRGQIRYGQVLIETGGILAGEIQAQESASTAAPERTARPPAETLPS